MPVAHPVVTYIQRPFYQLATLILQSTAYTSLAKVWPESPIFSQCPHCKPLCSNACQFLLCHSLLQMHSPHASLLLCRCQIRNKKKGKFTMTGTSNASSSGLQRTGSEISDSTSPYPSCKAHAGTIMVTINSNNSPACLTLHTLA